MSFKIASLLLFPSILCVAGAAPLIAAVHPPQPAPAEEAVDWNFGSFDSVLRQATRRERNVLIYFWMPGSGQCTQMYEQVWQDPELSHATEPFVCYSANHSETEGAALFERYQITTVPAVRIVRQDGAAEDGINGYADVVSLTAELERIGSGKGTLSDLRRVAEAAP